MNEKTILKVSIIMSIVLSLIGCSNIVPENFDVKKLTRVDVQVVKATNISEEVTIKEEEQVKILQNIWKQIEWKQNVKAEMSRKEDAKVTLFLMSDKQMPERLLEYFIWFHQSNELVTIIDREKNVYGILEKENVKKLKSIILNN